MTAKKLWTIDAFETSSGERPAWAFVASLGGRDRKEALALIKLLEEQGNELRRPQSAALDDGLFELRGKQVRIFFVFRPGRTVLLLDGEVKKRQEIPTATLQRMRRLQRELEQRDRKSPKPRR